MDVAVAAAEVVADSWARDNARAVVVVVPEYTDADAGSPLKDNSNDVDVVHAVWA